METYQNNETNKFVDHIVHTFSRVPCINIMNIKNLFKKFNLMSQLFIVKHKLPLKETKKFL